MARLLSDRPAMPARRLGDFWSMSSKHRLAARLASQTCFCALVFSLGAWAQIGTTSLQRVITDPSGGAVPDADLTLSDAA
jgi:hypothetical protein